MDWNGAYRAHVDAVSAGVERALALARERGEHLDGIVFHAGSLAHYHADDLAIPFRGVPHFLRFAPLGGPDHLLLWRPGRRARLVCVVPQDYWSEAPAGCEAALEEVFDVCEAPDLARARVLLGELGGCAYLGDSPEVARMLGVADRAIEPPALCAALDWERGNKTPYEVACIREAARIAGIGHAAVREAVHERHSEWEIHRTYLAETMQLEHETPYPNIIAWDDRSAILHYQTKRRSLPSPGYSFLIDAGARARGYACDITRSYVRPGAHPVFREVLARMQVLQRCLVDAVAPGVGFVELHTRAVAGVGEILCELGVLRVPISEALERGLVLPFLPHGLGHHLGLQVHDVGGQQVTQQGDTRPPPPEHSYLRTTRDLEPGHVVTIEPGLYFIEMLLAPHRSGADAEAFDWPLVDELVRCGGVRIEDDVWVTEQGREDLTRPHVPEG